MDLRQGYSYHIKDEFFELINDAYLMKNKENGNYRPHYFAIKDFKNEDIYYMIPISSKVDKYKAIIDNKIKRYGVCDTIIIDKFARKDNAFLLQNSFPIKSKYIDHIHTIDNIAVKVYEQLEKKLETSLMKLLMLKNKGKNMFFTDIDYILYTLLNE